MYFLELAWSYSTWDQCNNAIFWCGILLVSPLLSFEVEFRVQLQLPTTFRAHSFQIVHLHACPASADEGIPWSMDRLLVPYVCFDQMDNNWGFVKTQEHPTCMTLSNPSIQTRALYRPLRPTIRKLKYLTSVSILTCTHIHSKQLDIFVVGPDPLTSVQNGLP